MLAPPKEFGFNIIGHVSGNLGLGVSARNIVQVLLDNHFPVAVLDLDPGLGRQNYDRRFESLTVRSAEDAPFAVNLLILPPASLVKFIPQHLSALKDPVRLNAALVWWELPIISPHWRRALEFFDVLVAPSAFIRHTLDLQLNRALTISVRHPIYLPENVHSCRDRFDIKTDDIVFVTSFEIASDPGRKNILAVVEAFNRGLANVAHARLLIKLHNAESVPSSNRLMQALRKACDFDPRIRVIDEALTYTEVLRLYASSDVFVSLHRAEGLGFGPMEAMALGKVVIATAWSGNMTYMDHTNACLVPYTLAPVTAVHGAYSNKELAGLDPFWADPDVEAAAAWMRRLAEDRTLRLRIGERARNAIAAFQDEAAKSKFAFEIEAIWEHYQSEGLVRDLDARIDALGVAVQEWEQTQASSATNVRLAASRLLDRHLLWRFRR